ncbi:MAG TPA: polysaccharide pyruvyl transferase family protein [Methylophilaceae bacterium]|jgi:exopolysaccharide biosynthesis predicted pyruvyltransferase EpsI|nr:polysaccharide pyruvyl transferase family protein [Methylophilaceae bacterium]
MKNNQEIIKDLQGTASEILDGLIPPESTVLLLDYPNYSNVGDSLIWLGEVAYLRSRNLKPAYVCDLENYQPKAIDAVINHPKSKNPIILMQGGGNFGTLWPAVQAFRKKVLRDFSGIRTIQLPQSLYFDNKTEIRETARLIDHHGAFTLLTRDHPSHAFAQEHFNCDVRLCPDMAFFIGPLQSRLKAPFDRYILSRSDHEKSFDWLGAFPSETDQLTIDQGDWLEQGLQERILNRLQRHTVGPRLILDPYNRTLFQLWNLLARYRLSRGQTQLERGRVVISDRLHVHILCTLLDKPHVLIDNSYGKISSLHKAWTHAYAGVRFASSLSEALIAARDLESYPDENPVYA